MRKPLAAMLGVSALLTASVTHAETRSYIHTSASGGSSASVHISSTVSEDSGTVITINGEEVVNTFNTAPVTPPSAAKAPISPTEIQPARSSVTQTVTSNSASGTMHVYREENGKVTQNETIPFPTRINASVLPADFDFSGMLPVLFVSFNEQESTVWTRLNDFFASPLRIGSLTDLFRLR